MAEKIRVLYVDDESTLLELGKEFLERSGDFTVTTATSAPDAIRLLEKERFDAIVSDYQMPDMDGIEFLKHLKAEGNITPFIIFTGKGREEVVIEALNAGADFYLQKGGDSKSQFAELSNKIHYAVSRKKAEDLLRKSEEKYRHLIEHSDEAIVVAQDGMLKMVNHQTIEFMGYSEHELLSMSLSAFIHPDDRAMVMERYQKRLKGEELPPRYSFRLSPKDASTKWVEISVFAIDWEGRPATMNFLTDITERKRTQEARLESETRFRELFNKMSNCAAVYQAADNGADFVFVDFNPAAEKIEKIRKDEVIGRRVSEVFPGIREFGLLDVFSRVWRTGQPENHPISIYKDARIMGWRENFVYKLPSGEIVSVYDDITERKQAEDALRESEEKYHTVADFTFDWEFWIAPDGKFIYVSPSCERITGYRPEEFMLDPNLLITIVHKDDRDRIIDHISHNERVFGETGALEFRIITRSGEERWIGHDCQPVYGRNGDYRGNRGSNRDITDRKLAEEALRKAHDELENRVQQRTVELSRALETHGIEHQRLYDVLETLPVYICLLTPDHHMPFANKYFRETFGESKGRRCYEYLFNRTEPCETCETYAVMKTRAPHHWYWTGPNGRDYDIYNHPFIESDGSFYILEMGIDITDSKRQAKLALRESEEKYRRIIDTANEGIWQIDSQSATTIVNRKMAEMLGYTPEEVIGRNVTSFMHPDDRADHASRMEGRRKGYADQYERRFIKKDGTVIWTIVSATALENPDGTFKGAFAMFTDITERKRAEESLRESEERYRALVDNALEAILIFDFSGTALFANHAVATLVDVDDPRALIGRNVLEFIAPESRDTVLADFTSVMGGRDAYLAQYKVITATGQEKWVEAIGKKIQFGGVPADIVMLRDITGRKQIETALLKSETTYRELIELLPQTVFEIDHNGRVISVNPLGLKSFGYSKEDLEKGLNAFQVFAPKDHQRLAENIQRILQGEPSDAIEYSAQRKDGSTFPVITYSAPIIHEHTPVGLRGVLVDISERKQAEDALRHANKQLNLLSSITRHDILNQLLALRGYIEISHEYLDDKKALLDFLEREEKAAITIEHQIRFTKEYQEMGVAAPAWQNVNAIIKKMIAGLPMRDVRVDIDRTDLEIFADPLFKRVFYNLIDNALRYGGAGMKTIRVSSQESDTSLTIICEDEGVGISAEDKKHIFTRGFGKNTGLGLFLSREILAITGITIAETGETGKGARFEITVPKGAYRFTGTGEK